ncbi:hypothetical protein MCAMS1_02600 [biofilm metagenome]
MPIVFLKKIVWIIISVPMLVSLLYQTSAAANTEATSSLSSETYISTARPADIEVYVRTGCPHCAQAELFLQDLNREQPKLRFVIHDIAFEPAALQRLQVLAKQQGLTSARVPAFHVGGQLIVGFSDVNNTGQLIREALVQNQGEQYQDSLETCGAEQKPTCDGKAKVPTAAAQPIEINFFGFNISLDKVGLPLFTLAIGLLDGFNPCSLWVLLLMISLLAPMNNRLRMFVIAGSFIVVEGLAYFIFMTAWLNLFLIIGLSRISEIIIAAIALLAGAINLKDFWYYGRVISLSIPEAAKPGIYARMRHILNAQNLSGAIIGSVILAILVQVVELMCTSGFPALYTRILTLKHHDNASYYGYLLLYNLAYMFDDLIILTIGIVTLSQKRLQENEGRWLKLISGMVMVGLGIYLLLTSPA